MLSSSTFYTVKGSFFSKDFNEYLYENPFDSHYLHPDSSIRYDQYTFRNKGTNLHRFYRQTNTILGKVDFTSQVSQGHLLKLGAEIKSHNLKFDDYDLQPLTRDDGSEVKPFKPSIPEISDQNRSKYDTKPFEASAYFQDKIEYENVIINIGLRLDYFDANGKVLFDESEGIVSPLNGERINSFKDPNIYAPIHAPSYFGLSLPDDKWTEEYLNQYHSYLEQYFYKDSKAKYQISPRFGIAYPISAAGVVHFSYGHFLQIPTFQYLFQEGLYKVPNSGQFIGPFGNPDLEAQKTVMYEIGFRQEFFDEYVVDITGFYRDVRDWITAGPILYTGTLVSYSIFTNKDYANVKGITLTLNKRFSNYFSFDLNYTYQVAEGSNSKPEDTFDDAKGNNEPSLFLIPMNWDQNHLVNASLYTSYDNWGLSLLARYGTGLPYTPTVTQYTALRGLSSGFLDNSRRRPSQFTIDLKVDRTFHLVGLDITAFLKVFNLLDNRIPVNVFGDTGQPDFTTETQNVSENPERGNTVAEYIRYPDHYGEPRNIQVGFEFSF
jgi:hypothetical protein